jgi:hypothetical protein
MSILTHSPAIVRDGLVLCLDAGAVQSYPGSGDTWADLSGLKHDGLIVNAVAAAESGTGGTKSIAFDGSDDTVRRATAEKGGYDYDDSGGQFTVCVWLKPGTFVGADSYLAVFNRTVPSTSSHLHSCFLSSTSGTGSYGAAGSMASWIFNSGGSNRLHDSSSVCQTILDNWNFCVWRWADGTGYTYDLFNSAGHVTNTDTAFAVETMRTDTTSEYRIGAWDSTGYEFTGRISVVHQYNRKLTDAEIQQNYRTHKGRFGL